MKPSSQQDGFVILSAMTRKIHYFNPGHETAILLGTENYTPPANVQRMTKELAFLPAWYANPEDYVLIDEINSLHFLSLQPEVFHPFATPVMPKEINKFISSSEKTEAAPWGLSPHSIQLFEKLKKKFALNIAVPSWKEEYKRLAGRQTAAECLEMLRNLLPGISNPSTPAFCTQIDEIKKHLTLHHAPFILKTPYSSSGRGLHWINRPELTDKDKAWINGAFNKQGTISIEYGLDKVQDFAMEFYSDGKGTVEYKGLSVFNTEEKGSYSGNILQNQEDMRALLCRYSDKDKFQQIQNAVCLALQKIYGNIYTGYLGVDMLVYREKNGNYSIHPCIEINMRYTMGMVAIRLFEKYIDLKKKGNFCITYSHQTGEAYENHHFMEKAYPLKLENGKITEGYLSLCPVTKETRYRAYILMT
ncbi:hypothetical protein [Parabacteroides chinchillae]